MTESRVHPLAKPEGFVPAVQRYSAVLDRAVTTVQFLYVGVQVPKEGANQAPTPDIEPGAEAAFLTDVSRLFGAEDGPEHHDFARYVDQAGATNTFAVAYWADRDRFLRWSERTDVMAWWADEYKESGPAGYFWEPAPVETDLLETIAFAEYIRGLSACPMSTVEPMGESGYWGAARDRIPRSATDRLEPTVPTQLEAQHGAGTAGRRVTVQPPERYCLIRSGVSWADCGPEQLSSYRDNVEPRLNAGMEFLRQNPVISGCWSMRQVDVITAAGQPTKETYCAGHFVSFGHLEDWAHHHPTHLAIYGQAQKERIKYQEDLELRTYHEVYVVESPDPFQYVNCHPDTGALGWLVSGTAPHDGRSAGPQ